MKKILFIFLNILFIFYSISGQSKRDELLKNSPVSVMLYQVKYKGDIKSEDKDRIQSVEKNITERIKIGLQKTGKFNVINTVFSKEFLQEITATQQGLTENKERLKSDFSKYGVFGYYFEMENKIFLTVSLIDMSNGEIILSSFDEADAGNSTSIYDACMNICFALVGLSYKKSNISDVDLSQESKLISGFSVNIYPKKGSLAVTLMADKEYKFDKPSFTLPPLPAGEYKITIEKTGYYTQDESIFIDDTDNKNVDIYLREKTGYFKISIEDDADYSIIKDTKLVVDDGTNDKSEFSFFDEMRLADRKLQTYKLSFLKNKYYPINKEITVVESEDGVKTEEILLDFTVKPVEVLFTSTVKWTSVFVDGLFYGITPFVRKLPEGIHTITYKKYFYKPSIGKIEIKTPVKQTYKGSIEIDMNRLKLSKEFYPHFFFTTSLYGGIYSNYYLNAVGNGVPDNQFGNRLFNLSLDFSMGLDIEYIFFGAKALYTFYNKKPQWATTPQSLFSIDMDLIPYLGFKVYPGLWTSFDFGLGIDLPVFTTSPFKSEFSTPISSLTAEHFKYFQNYLFLFNITFYNNYKREVFSFVSMIRLDFFDALAYPNEKINFRYPVMTYIGMRFPLVFTDSKKRMEQKNYERIIKNDKVTNANKEESKYSKTSAKVGDLEK